MNCRDIRPGEPALAPGARANASYNATIAPGATVTVGFTGTCTTSNAPPPAFTLNGTAC